MPDEKSHKPRELIHRVQAECISALDRLRRARRAAVDDAATAEAEAQLHDAVMLYWEQIKRFRDREHIEAEWHEQPVYDDTTLDDLEAKRLTTQQVEERHVDPDTGTEHTVTVEQPWRLSPRQAVQVLDQLDVCANTLGFDAEPVEVRKKFGYEEVDLDEDGPSRFDPQPVEVPNDD